MKPKVLQYKIKPQVFRCNGTQRASGLAVCLGLLFGLAGCASSEDFQTKGKPALTLNRIQVISSAKQNYDDSIEAFKKGNMAEAKVLLKKALKESLSNKEYKIAYDCYMGIGRCEEVQENLDEAESYFRQTLVYAEKHFPNNKSKISDAVASLGQVLAKKGNHKGGEKLLRKAVDIRISQENWEMALDHALKLKWFYEKTNQPTKQIDNLQELIELQRRVKTADHLALAKLYFEKGQKEIELHRRKNALESFKATREALKEAPNNLESGALYVDFAKVLKQLDKVSESDHAILIAEQIAKASADSPSRTALREKILKFKINSTVAREGDKKLPQQEKSSLLDPKAAKESVGSGSTRE